MSTSHHFRKCIARARSIFAAGREWIVSTIISAGARNGSAWKISRMNDRWVMTRDESPFYLKGVAAWEPEKLEVFAALGGNCIRASANRTGLNRAAKLGVKILVNLPTRGERDGLDWDDLHAIAKQKEEMIGIVRTLKHHPAVLMWSVGNELDWKPAPDGNRPPTHPDLWKHLDDLVRAIKEVDPIHPVTVCTGMETKPELLESKLAWIQKDCPSIDVLGITAFHNIPIVAETVRTHWGKPYFFAEWSATPPWRALRTAWEAPLEPTSSMKASFVGDCYRKTILPDDTCIGAFLFFWGERHERTHTWFGLIRDGMRTESLDVMQRVWTGSWPDNRAPGVLGLSLSGYSKHEDIRLAPGILQEAQVHCFDPDSDDLEISWHIRADINAIFGTYAGEGEPHPEPIPGLISHQAEKRVRFLTPTEPGAYRLYVQVTDGHDNVGYANVPFLVEG